MRVLFVAHGHPALATGGGEIAAWRLFQHCSSQYGTKNCGFLSAAPLKLMPLGCELLGWSPRQWLIPASPYSATLVHDTCIDLRRSGALHQALVDLNPQIIHFHHYLHVGVDLLTAFRRWFPSARILLTLHEYWGPCAYEGRLLRRSGELCLGGSVDECTACVGEEHREALTIREKRLKRFFQGLDHCVAPSYFLKRRYLDWGLNPRRLSVIENLPAESTPLLSGKRQEPGLVVGFLGQINPWKGIDLILKAMVWIRLQEPELSIRLQLHGLDADQLKRSADPYLQRCARLVELLGPEVVELCGAFSADELPDRLAGLDAVVMGSIWYENSPMVIQESYQYGLPVLAPRLGGMAEKIRHERTGLLFEPGKARDLANCMARLIREPDLLTQLAAHAQQAGERLDRAAEQHERLYKALLKKPAQ